MIELAQATVLFSGKNYKAVGICYNNIGNLHYKCQKYELAADSFNKAIQMANVCLRRIEIEDFYENFPRERP